MKNPLLLGRAVPAFNFYNLESFRAIATAAGRRPVIFSASESAIKYMGDDFLRDFVAPRCWLHLDHGHSLNAVKHAIALGFSSVMIDGSALPYAENVKLTRAAVKYARARGVPVEAELGTLSGFEEDVPDRIRIRDSYSRRRDRARLLPPNPQGSGGVKVLLGERPARAPAKLGWGKSNTNPEYEYGAFTNPRQALDFVAATGCDSLAIAIGTSHGAYKGNGKLRFDILSAVRKLLPRTPLVLHGASTIPQKYARDLGLKGAEGISAGEIRRAIRLGINKVNIDSDARMAWTAGLRSFISKEPNVFDPRAILAAATAELIKLYQEEIRLVCG